MSKIYHSLPRRGACAFVQLFQAGHIGRAQGLPCRSQTKHRSVALMRRLALLRTVVILQCPMGPVALSQGRFRLGLGTQVRAHVERRYASPWSGSPGPA